MAAAAPVMSVSVTPDRRPAPTIDDVTRMLFEDRVAARRAARAARAAQLHQELADLVRHGANMFDEAIDQQP